MQAYACGTRWSNDTNANPIRIGRLECTSHPHAHVSLKPVREAELAMQTLRTHPVLKTTNLMLGNLVS